MREMRRGVDGPIGAGRWSQIAAFFFAAALAAGIAAAPSVAAVGYELNSSTPSQSLGSRGPHGIAVDQASQRIYVAILTANTGTGPPGEIARFNSNLTDAGSIAVGSGYYAGVAVNPATQGVYAAQAVIHIALGDVGAAKMDLFSSAGSAGTSFGLSDTGALPQIAADSTGRVYFPNAATDSVQVFNAAGVLQEEISCSACPGGTFGKPVSVALNSEDDLYVADLAPDRVVKLTSSGGPYTYASTLQSGLGAASVGVDPSTDDVLVGDLPGGHGYRVRAYDSAGVQFDDFGAGMFTDPSSEFGAVAAHQIAANATTHQLYVGDLNKFYVFDKVTTHAPTATATPATPVGQITATLHALVNVSGHTTLECKFEYTDDADFQANTFSNAKILPCPNDPAGPSAKTIDAKVSGLAPTTVHHYRVTVRTFVGTTTSGAGTFETLPVVPATVTTEAPAGVAQSVATLIGKVNPHGGSVSSCRFEYGTSTAYGSKLACTKSPEPVASDVAVSRSVSGLAPGTTYHYKLVVTSNAGTVSGKDVEFTTTAPPPPPPIEPPPSTSPTDSATPPPSTPPPTVTPRPLRCKKGFRKKRVKGKLKCVKKRHAKRRRAQRP